jgi:hypothetical protein
MRPLLEVANVLDAHWPDVECSANINSWQPLSLHPHLHCIVPGGGLSKQGKWKTARSDGKYLFNVKAMSDVFRGKYIALIKEVFPQSCTPALLKEMYKHPWVVYAKQPFESTHSVIEYLGRYTHKIAITNHRLLSMQEGKVSFTYKDYKHGSVTKSMELDGMEFIRRFTMHILPRGFVRIRHYGILSSCSKQAHAVTIKQQLPPIVRPAYLKPKIKREPYNPKQCPCCKKDSMEILMHYKSKPPPYNWQQIATNILAALA